MDEIKKNSTAVDSKCPNCGGKLDFMPKIGKWKCNHCDSEFSLKELEKKMNSAASDEKNKHEELDEDSGNLFQYNCPDCGAVIVADEQTTATFCIYCGNTAILKNKLAGKFHPSSVIPFKKTKEDAVNAFKSLAKGRMFIPNDFTDEKNIEKIRGVYIPFWLYDIDFNGVVDATGRKVTTWKVGRTHFTKTDTYNMHRDGDMSFEKVPVDGSTRFENDLMNSIEPFNYEELVDYNHAYLSGFLAEKYDIEEDKCYEDAKKRITNTAEKQIISTFTYPGSIRTKTYTDKETNFYYVLLPVYMLNIKYRDKMRTFAMNGQTGKFIGDIPVDLGKVFYKSLILFLILFASFELIIFLGYLLGANL